MYSTFYRDDRAAALNQVPYGSPERIPAEVVRVVAISWDELKNIEALSGLDDYQLDDIGVSHTQICSLAPSTDLQVTKIAD